MQYLSFSLQGCRSLPASHPGFVSVDSETGIRYLSHQHPRQPQLFSVVRQACVRSLSCEVCIHLCLDQLINLNLIQKMCIYLYIICSCRFVLVERGPSFLEMNSTDSFSLIRFSSKTAWHGASSAGTSIVVVAMDRIYLINSWPFLLRHLRLTIQSLQNTALKVLLDCSTTLGPRLTEYLLE